MSWHAEGVAIREPLFNNRLSRSAQQTVGDKKKINFRRYCIYLVLVYKSFYNTLCIYGRANKASFFFYR